MESGWNVWVWLVGVVSKRRVWLVGEGGIYGCGSKEVYRFPHTTVDRGIFAFFFFRVINFRVFNFRHRRKRYSNYTT